MSFFLALLLFLPLPQSESPPIVISDVTVIDVTGGVPSKGRTVVIRADRIVAIEASEGFTAPEGARLVNGTGRFLIPGLWDMHVHMTFSPRFTDLYIANGVTGIRDMFSPGGLDAVKNLIRDGTRVGPRIISAGRIVDGPDPVWPGSVEVKNPEDGRAAVTRVKEEGSDFVKVYSKLGKESFLAIAAEAKRQGIPFAGHVPHVVTVAEASDAGQKSIEHLTGVLAACSPDEERFLKRGAGALGRTERNRLALESYSEERAQALFAKLKANGTWQCPTLVVLRSIAHLDDPEFTNDPRVEYVEFMKTMWNPQSDFRFKTFTDEDWEWAKKVYRKSVEIIGAMHRAGVPIIAGTDTANPYCFPGFSLHDELQLFVEAGLTPLEALRTATSNPAKYLGMEKTHGPIAVGKAADLVLLDANPLEDIRNTTKIAAVVAAGRLFTSEDLAKLRGK